MHLKLFTFIIFCFISFYSSAEPDKWEVLYPAKAGVKHKFYESRYFTVDTVDEYVKVQWDNVGRLQCYEGIDGEYGFISINGTDVKLKTVCDGRWAEIEVVTPQGMKFIYDQLYASNKIEGKIVLANNRYKIRNLTFRKTIKDRDEKEYKGYGKPVNQNSNGLWLVSKKNHNEIKLFPSAKRRRDKFISLVFAKDTGKVTGKVDLSSALWSGKTRNSHNQLINPSLRLCDYRKRNDVAVLTINSTKIDIPIECKTRGGRTFRNRNGEPVNVGNWVVLDSTFDFELDEASIRSLKESKAIEVSFTNYHLVGNTFLKKIELDSSLNGTIKIYDDYMKKLKEDKLEADKNKKSKVKNAL